MDKDIIKFINNEFIDSLLMSKDSRGRFVPLGLFITKNEYGAYTAIDNSAGYAFTEDFETIHGCIKWLFHTEDFKILDMKIEKDLTLSIIVANL